MLGSIIDIWVKAKEVGFVQLLPQRPSSTAYPRVIQIDRRHPDRHVRVRVVSRQ